MDEPPVTREELSLQSSPVCRSTGARIASSREGVKCRMRVSRRDLQVVFNEHHHSYQRSQPIRGGRFVAPDAGTVYITAGGRGAGLYQEMVGSTDLGGGR